VDETCLIKKQGQTPNQQQEDKKPNPYMILRVVGTLINVLSGIRQLFYCWLLSAHVPHFGYIAS